MYTMSTIQVVGLLFSKKLFSRMKKLNSNVVVDGARRDLSEEEVTRLYFSQLSDEEVAALFRVYEWDFRMFGYDFEFRGRRYPPPGDGHD